MLRVEGGKAIAASTEIINRFISLKENYFQPFLFYLIDASENNNNPHLIIIFNLFLRLINYPKD